MRALKLKCSSQPLAIDKDQLKGSSKMILLELHEKLHSIQCPSFYSHSALERQGSSICGCLMSWLKNLKKNHFEVSSSLILCNKNDPFPNWILTCDEKWILYNNQGQPVQCLDWEEAPKHFPKPNLHRKKMSWSLFGHLLPVWYTTAFWIPVKPLHLRSMLSKSMTWTENCNACSWRWSTERAQFFTTMPDCTLHNQCFKSWMNWVKKFCLIHHIHLTTKHHDNFLQGKHFPNQQEAENAFQEFIESQGPEFLYYRNTQTCFSLSKLCWL